MKLINLSFHFTIWQTLWENGKKFRTSQCLQNIESQRNQDKVKKDKSCDQTASHSWFVDISETSAGARNERGGRGWQQNDLRLCSGKFHVTSSNFHEINQLFKMTTCQQPLFFGTKGGSSFTPNLSLPDYLSTLSPIPDRGPLFQAWPGTSNPISWLITRLKIGYPLTLVVYFDGKKRGFLNMFNIYFLLGRLRVEAGHLRDVWLAW